MKKTILLSLIFVIMSFTNMAQAQDPPLVVSNPRYELGISYGFFPVVGYATLITYDYPVQPMLVYEKYEELYDVIQVGNFNFQYQHHFNKRHSVGMITSYLLRIYRVGSVNNREFIAQNHYLTFQGNYRYTYKRYNNCSLYSAFSLGVVLYSIDSKIKEDMLSKPALVFKNPEPNDPTTFLSPSAHLTLLGLRIGKTNASQIELGFGTQGILKVGYSYQF
jgi:hypothetical protein